MRIYMLNIFVSFCLVLDKHKMYIIKYRQFKMSIFTRQTFWGKNNYWDIVRDMGFQGDKGNM